MDVLVAYDVATDTPQGRRRLRRVANVCVAFGQRVQYSVFECTLNEMQLERLTARLLREIDDQEDSLRIYRLREPKLDFVDVFGRRTVRDLSEPLII